MAAADSRRSAWLTSDSARETNSYGERATGMDQGRERISRRMPLSGCAVIEVKREPSPPNVKTNLPQQPGRNRFFCFRVLSSMMNFSSVRNWWVQRLYVCVCVCTCDEFCVSRRGSTRDLRQSSRRTKVCTIDNFSVRNFWIDLKQYRCNSNNRVVCIWTRWMKRMITVNVTTFNTFIQNFMFDDE